MAPSDDDNGARVGKSPRYDGARMGKIDDMSAIFLTAFGSAQEAPLIGAKTQDDDDTSARVSVAKALNETFGDRAHVVALKQARLASGEVLDSWLQIAQHLDDLSRP